MTLQQQNAVKRLLLQHRPGVVLHGSALGADAEFDMFSRRAGAKTYCYPSNIGSQRAATTIELDDPAPPLLRNRRIVDESALMYATPKGFEEELRSGTWSTIRYARSTGKPLFVVYPDGRVEDETDKISF